MLLGAWAASTVVLLLGAWAATGQTMPVQSPPKHHILNLQT